MAFKHLPEPGAGKLLGTMEAEMTPANTKSLQSPPEEELCMETKSQQSQQEKR